MRRARGSVRVATVESCRAFGLALLLATGMPACSSVGPRSGEADGLAPNALPPVSTAASPAGTPTMVGDGPVFLVKDLFHPPATSAEPRIGLGAKVLFVGNDGVRGGEPWISDGTDAGTVILADLNPGAASSDPDVFVSFGDLVLFTANDGVHGRELWRTDGTSGGTVMVKDLAPGAASGVSGTHLHFAADGPRVFFVTYIDGDELWQTDGTAAGTTLVTTVTYPEFVTEIAACGMRLFYLVADGYSARLWTSDGTPDGTMLAGQVAGWGYFGGLTCVGAVVYFTGHDPDHGSELWRSDGTTAGTHLVKDVKPGTSGSAPFSLTAVGSRVFFSADDGVHGRELWVSDGSDAGTTLVKDSNPSGDMTINFAMALGGLLLFIADDGLHGYAPWTSDGTAAGTHLIEDVVPNSLYPKFLTLFDGVVYYSSAPNLWRTDGTAAGTYVVTTLDSSPWSSIGGWPVVHAIAASQTALFLGVMQDSQSPVELWKSDGTAAGTVRLQQYAAQQPSPMNLVDVGGTLFFTASDSIHGREVWRTDGTEAGTLLVKDVRPGTASMTGNYGETELVSLGGRLLFTADSGGGRGMQLWTSDGTDAGTAVLTPAVGSPESLAVWSGHLYLSGYDSTHGAEPWVSDGTAAGTKMLADLWPGFGSGWPSGFTPCLGRLFFAAEDGVHGRELWSTDGTASGTGLVADMDPAGSGWPADMACAGSRLFFTARNKSLSQYKTLWQSDGTASGTSLVKLIDTTSVFFEPRDLAAVGDVLLFVAGDAATGSHVWRSDGTAAGTVAVGTGYSASNGLGVVGGFYYFDGSTTAMGAELWRTDGTAAGTRLVKDVWPGSGSGLATTLLGVGESLLFFADDGVHGSEPWRSYYGVGSGTSLLQDLQPGSGASRYVPGALARSGSNVYFPAMRGISSNLFGVAVAAVADVSPPVTSVPAPIVAEATGPGGATVSFGAAVTDGEDPQPWVTCAPASGSRFPLGSTTVTCTGSDHSGNTTPGSFSISVQDTTPPSLSGVPGNLVREATGPAGAVASWAPPQATDLVSGTVSVSCLPPAGGLFPLGATSVSCSAHDAAGNQAVTAFDVLIRDTTAPSLVVPAALTVEATNPLGTPVSFTAGATDLVDPAPLVACSPPSGSGFLVGETLVACSATDASGNVATASFVVTITDTTPPLLLGLPADIVAEAGAPEGTPVAWTAPSAVDDGDPAPVVACAPPSGAVFALGTTAVACTATDFSGNVASGVFAVTVLDTTPPALVAPTSVQAIAATSTGALVRYVVTARDLVSGELTPACTPASGSAFAPGTTPVRCTATDAAGNVGSATFEVSVTFEWSGLRFGWDRDEDDCDRDDGCDCDDDCEHGERCEPGEACRDDDDCARGHALPPRFRLGRGIPMWFELEGASAGIRDLAARVLVAQVEDGVEGPLIAATSAFRRHPGNSFRYQGCPRRYYFTLSTRPLSAGTWNIVVDLGDGVLHREPVLLWTSGHGVGPHAVP